MSIANNYGVRVHKVPSYRLGEGVLGRAWIYDGLIEIRYDLRGEEFEEVLLHEMIHMKYRLDEYKTRALTRIALLAR